MTDFRRYSELYHHGVQGQKWGVRNGPPYPIEDKVLRKGTKLEHVSKHYTALNNKLLLDHFAKTKKWMYTYRPEEEWDRKVYQGPFSKFLALYVTDGRTPEVHKYEVKKDLKMPTKKERIDAFMEIYKKHNKDAINELQGIQDRLREMGFPNVHGSLDVDLKNVKTEKDIKAAYVVFNHVMESAHRYKITQAYCKYMAKRFDAMVDDNNQGVYNRAHDPIIIFNAKNLLASKELSRQLTVMEIMQNTSEVEKVLAKYGEKVKL